MDAITSFTNYIRIERRYSEHTVIAYTEDINQFLSFCHSKYLSEDLFAVEQLHIREWVISLLNGSVSSRTIRRKIASLNTFYKYCLKNSWIAINPAKGIILPRMEKKLPEFVDHAGIEALFEAPQFNEGFSGLRDRIVIELFYSTGMRLSELVNLELNSYDPNKQELKVLGKRNKERIIPLTPKLCNLLEHYLDLRKGEYTDIDHQRLIVTNKGEPAYPRMIQRLVRQYLSLSTTLEKKSPHLLRHTFATHMLNNGADLNAVKELLGHANLAATEIYTHNTYEKLKSIYKQAHPRA